MKIIHIIPASVTLLLLTLCITMFYSCAPNDLLTGPVFNDSTVMTLSSLSVSSGPLSVRKDSVVYDASSTQWIKFKVQFDSLITDCPDTSLATAGYYFLRQDDNTVLYSFERTGMSINNLFHSNTLTLSTGIPYNMRFVFYVKFHNVSPLNYFIRAKNIRLIRTYP